MTKFQSYLSSYHPMQKAWNWKSGLDMERWLTPWMTSTHERPFTWEGSYLVEFVDLHSSKMSEKIFSKDFLKYSGILVSLIIYFFLGLSSEVLWSIHNKYTSKTISNRSWNFWTLLIIKAPQNNSDQFLKYLRWTAVQIFQIFGPLSILNISEICGTKKS